MYQALAIPAILRCLIGKIVPILMKNGSLRYGLLFQKAIALRVLASIYTCLFVRAFVPFAAAISISPSGMRWKILISKMS